MEENKILIDNRDYSEIEAINIALNFQKKCDFKKSSAIYRKINKHNPANADVYHLSGLILYHYGFLEAAIYWINRAIKINPLPSYFYNKGIVYMDLENKEEAKKNFNEALKINSNYEKAKIIINKML